jgi:transaldolase
MTVNTMPEKTLNALASHTEKGRTMATDGGDCETILAQFAALGVDVDLLAERLQTEGAQSFVASWNELMGVIASKNASLTQGSGTVSR